MRKMLLIILLALLFGATAVWLVQQDQGYLLISLGATTIEMSFWTGGIIYLLSCCLFVWLLLILRWLLDAGGIRDWWQSRRTARQTSKTASGLLLFLNRDWQASNRMLSQSAANSSIPQVNLLFAAKAAAENKQLDQSRQLLERLKAQHPDAALYADLCLAEALIEDLKLEEALAILVSLDQNHKMVLRLLSKVYRLQTDWRALCALIPAIKRQSVFDKQGLRSLQVEGYCGMLNRVSNGSQAIDQQKILEDIWSTIPRAIRQVPEILIAYTDALVAVNCSDKGVLVLTKALKNQWHGPLVERFGNLQPKDSTKQLMLGEQWLEKHIEDPQLLMALGRICRHMGFLGKARDYMTSTIAIQPTAEAYYELSAVLSLMGDGKGSADMQRRGLDFVIESSKEGNY